MDNREARKIFGRRRVSSGESQDNAHSSNWPRMVYSFLLLASLIGTGLYLFAGSKTDKNDGHDTDKQKSAHAQDKENSAASKRSTPRKENRGKSSDEARHAKRQETENSQNAQPATEEQQTTEENSEVRALIVSQLQNAVDKIEMEAKQRTYAAGTDLSEKSTSSKSGNAEEIDTAVKGAIQEIDLVLAEIRHTLAKVARKDPNEQRIQLQKRKQADALREQSKQERQQDFLQ